MLHLPLVTRNPVKRREASACVPSQLSSVLETEIMQRLSAIHMFILIHMRRWNADACTFLNVLMLYKREKSTHSKSFCGFLSLTMSASFYCFIIPINSFLVQLLLRWTPKILSVDSDLILPTFLFKRVGWLLNSCVTKFADILWI